MAEVKTVDPFGCAQGSIRAPGRAGFLLAEIRKAYLLGLLALLYLFFRYPERTCIGTSRR
jgi:hypothetical protein